MNSQSRRQKYWSRSLVGYSAFSNAKPNKGHKALARLEQYNYIGVDLEECTAYDQLSQSIGFSVAAAPQVHYYGNHLVLGIIRGHFIAS